MATHFEWCRRHEEPTNTVGIAIRGWKASTRAGYASHLPNLAYIEDELGEEGNSLELLSRKLARPQAQHEVLSLP